jgi:hypothetical protein
MVKGTRVVFAEPGMLKGVRAINFVRLGEVEPKVVKGFPGNELKLGESV